MAKENANVILCWCFCVCCAGWLSLCQNFSEISKFLTLFLQNISLMAAGIPDLLSAHHIVLRYDVTIPKKSHQELKNYKQPVSVD